MKTVKYVAEGSCKVKVGGVEYSGTMVIPVGGEKGLSDEDVKRLLKDKFIRKVELDEGGAQPASSPDGKKPGETNKNKEKLIAKAKELGIETDENFCKLSEDEMRQKIAEASEKKPLDRTALLAKAAELGLADKITDATTDEEIQKLIAEAQGNSVGNTGGKTLEQMNKEELKAEAERLGVKVGFTDSEDKIRQKIKEAQGAV